MVENTDEQYSLEALRTGDKAEFARLVEAYSAPIYRLALKMLSDPQEAEDVLQITFLKAFQHTKLIATHDLDLVLDLCDRTLVMHQGRIQADG